MITKNIATMKSEVAAHIAADAVLQGTYWEKADNAVSGRGCFIGCLTHSNDARMLEKRFGLPLPLVLIAERIFEGLSASDAKAFFAAIPEAIGHDGKDLSRAQWVFLGRLLRRLPPQTGSGHDAITPVIEGMDILARGDDWTDAAEAACTAADAADATYATYAAANAARAAYAAARAAADAAYAAYAAYAAAHAARAAAHAAAEFQRQRDDFIAVLKLIKEA